MIECGELTCFHEVAVPVVEYFVGYLKVGGFVSGRECLPGPGRSVVMYVGHLDPVIDEESQDVGSQVKRKHGKVNKVVVVQEIDPQTGRMNLLVFHQQLTCTHTLSKLY